MYQRSAQGWVKHLDFLIVDELALQLAFILASLIRLNTWAYSNNPYRVYVFLIILIDALVAIGTNSFHEVLIRGYAKELSATVKHCFLVFCLMAVFMFATQTGAAYSRILLFLTFFFHIVVGYATRIAWKRIVRRYGLEKRKRRSMLVVLSEEFGESILQRLLDNDTEDYKITGLVFNRETEKTELLGVPVVATLDDAAQYICREWIDEVFIGTGDIARMPETLIDQCRQMGVTVHLQTLPMGSGKQVVENIAGMPVITNSINIASPLQLLLKRLIDIVCGLVLSLFALLAIAIVGPIIKHKSPGPILYKQERIGQNGRRFRMYKIRSMYMDADARKQELMEQNRVADGRMFKLDFDPRIIGNEVLPDGTRKTGIGEFLRKYSIDETPQGFNILLNQMSLVGTRPPTVDEWEKYELHHRARLATKPGITGMWQVSGRSEITDFEEITRLDTEYIENWSVGLDIRIMVKTIGAVLRHKGAM